MRPGWTAEVEVDADLGKVPNDPIEAAKYGIEQVHKLSGPIVKVEHHHEDGTVTTWLVDTTDASVTEIGRGRDDPDWEDYEPVITDEDRECHWAHGEHAGGLFLIQFSKDVDDTVIGCRNHVGDLMGDAPEALIFSK